MAEDINKQQEEPKEPTTIGQEVSLTPENKENNPNPKDINELQSFKKILEYFAGHIQYLCSSEDSKWKLIISEESHCPKFSDEIINSINNSQDPEWYSAGQGYNGDRIQDFMEYWIKQLGGKNSFTVPQGEEQKICITVIGFATTDGAYLHLVNTRNNAKSNATNINLWIAKEKTKSGEEIISFKGFEVGPGKHSTYDFPCLQFTFKDLGLDESSPSTVQDFNLRLFFEYFIEMRTQELNGSFERIGKMGALTYKGKEQLLATHNLILTGAPGTGKTWSAKNIASWIICDMSYEELTKKELKNDPENSKKLKDFEKRCKVVQFHPSYDYTDFVEGLRPTLGDEAENNAKNTENAPKATQVGFERVDGVFKKFCKEAAKQWDECHKQIEEFLENKCVKKEDIDKLTDAIIINDKITLNEEIFPEDSFCPEDSERLNNCKKVVEKVTKKHAKKYVFIIDEINRGELSKIFGELFYSIDPGYRGEDGRVDTQYQNMITDDSDEFKSGFYVPENVYVIGTMNDIDRSVESMDFAMRRRFSFIEVKANERMDMWNEEKDKKWADLATSCMEAINKKIEGLPGLSSAYHIGPAYFKKLNNYMEQQGDDYPDFVKLWDNHLYGVIFEYLRGKKDAEKTMIEIQEKYLNTLVKAVIQRFNYGGKWGSLLIDKYAKANAIDPSIDSKDSAKKYLDKIRKNMQVLNIDIESLYSKEIEPKTKPEEKDIIKKERHSRVLKLNRQIKYMMSIGMRIENLS